MVEIWDITVPELTGDIKRKVYVYLPDSYGIDPEKRYPVLYMFDGHNVFLIPMRLMERAGEWVNTWMRLKPR